MKVDDQEVEMMFLTNNLEWSAASIVELYRSRWQIEVFFKQIKQTLQLANFLGTSANAVRWQAWTTLLVYLLLRYLAFLSESESQLQPDLCLGASGFVAKMGCVAPVPSR